MIRMQSVRDACACACAWKMCYIRMFSGFRSRCVTFMPWQYLRIITLLQHFREFGFN
jgi:hypothetical protein